ncbi:uncharacterized protein C8Q71DRAFT_704888 [Rhodofomes roseus]|uniref:Signal sequence receptor subunit alpha n=1 Tax=Rhodofomes roseus TaxID=34475 RepID=A0ABQ8KLA6_9APHY|nr:uncharacterized protein C8Q71DRAFT_704888 [Rhodofomes roseus]KAH9838362.1 hypothetical protein C8Q71DRAFT_704888 [Rhodofomes roseus]
MRVQSFLGYTVGAAALLQLAMAAPEPVALEEPVVLATAQFPEDNAFGHVVNGERNKLLLNVENQSDLNITIKSVGGSFHYADSNKLIKNASALAYDVLLLEGAKMQLPYTFYSEFKPGDLRLNLWLDHEADGHKYRVTAYDSIVTIVEPESALLDFKMLSTYLVVSLLLGGLGYYAYLSFVPQPKKKRAPAVSAPVGTVTATGAGGYQEEWIPEHHLKKTKARKTRSSGVVNSGDETSGTEFSGTEGRKRKGKK